MMTTVVLTPAQVEALRQLQFRAFTFHIVKQDRTRTIAEVGLGLGCYRRATAKLPTHHGCITHIPVIITHCPPNSFVADFDTPLAATVTIHHTNGWFVYRNKQIGRAPLMKSIQLIIA